MLLTVVTVYTSPQIQIHPLYHLVERRYQCLCQPEAEDQLRPSHQKLWRQPLEEAGEPFVPHHVPHDPETAFRVIEVSVLYPGFDDI